MAATSREINVARMEHENNKHWQDHFDDLCTPEEYMLAWAEFERLTGEGSLSRYFRTEYTRAAILLTLAMLRLNEEAVRRGILPEQEINGKE